MGPRCPPTAQPYLRLRARKLARAQHVPGLQRGAAGPDAAEERGARHVPTVRKVQSRPETKAGKPCAFTNETLNALEEML